MMLNIVFYNMVLIECIRACGVYLLC